VGLKSVVARNGKEGVELVSARMNSGKPFDLIFMDIHMPEMDGMEAAMKIAALGCQTPIVAMTANVMFNDIELYKKSGMSEYLSKPFTSQELWRCLLLYLPATKLTDAGEGNQTEEHEKLQHQLKLSFVKDKQTVLEEFKNALDDGDIKTAHRIVHTLKSNAAQIGKTKLQKAAAAVEKAVKSGANALTEEQFQALEAELGAVLEELKPLLAETDASVEKMDYSTDAERIRAIYEKLGEMLANRNPECMNMLDEVRAIPGVATLVRQVEDFEFKKAEETLAILKGTVQ
jgi:CheY-like chemotaxis protein